MLRKPADQGCSSSHSGEAVVHKYKISNMPECGIMQLQLDSRHHPKAYLDDPALVR